MNKQFTSNQFYFAVVEEFKKWVHPDSPLAVAVLKTLSTVIKMSESTTIMGLQSELNDASNQIKSISPSFLHGRTAIALSTGCDLFSRYVTRGASEMVSPKELCY